MTIKVKSIKRTGDTLYNMFSYFCSRIDFGKSYLDADGIASMNRLFLELKKDTRKIVV